MSNGKSAKSFWDSKLVWAILAALGSVLLWVYVTFVEGDVITADFNGVAVEFYGADLLRDEQGLIITNVSDYVVSVSLTGTRSELSRLDSSSMTARIDVSNIAGIGEHRERPDIVFAPGISRGSILASEISTAPISISYSVVREISKTIDVMGRFNGTVAEGFFTMPPVFNPVTVIIRGPQDEINQVQYAWVDITREDLDATRNFESTYILVDADLNEVPLGNIKLERETVDVTIQVLMQKEIPLTVDIVEGAGATSQNIKITCEPASILISGDKETLDAINRISLDTVDLSSFGLVYEQTLPIHLDNGITNVTGITEAKVKIEVIGLETKSFTVTNISVVNITEGYEMELLTESLEVTIRGPAEVLERLKANNIRVVADAADIGAATGEFAPSAKVIIDDDFTGVGALGTYEIYIRILVSTEQSG
jgi:YbbR domain-containing protein